MVDRQCPGGFNYKRYKRNAALIAAFFFFLPVIYPLCNLPLRCGCLGHGAVYIFKRRAGAEKYLAFRASVG
jgi:hypothetical protein